MTGGRADLHVHTRASDGLLSPTEVVLAAASAGLSAVGIADHDTLAGIPEAAGAARQSPSLRVVPAVEINTDFGAIEVHVLGYFPDLEDQEFRDFLGGQAASRAERAARMVHLLRGLGFDVDLGRVRELAAGGVLGRPHVAAALVEKGYALSFGDAMGRLLARGRPGYVPRHKLSPHEAVKAIIRARGVPVLAHPGAPACDEVVPELVDAGLAGLEAFHPLHSPAQERRYAKMARLRGLVITGGTDFHGPAASPGAAAIGDVWVPVETVQDLLARVPS